MLQVHRLHPLIVEIAHYGALLGSDSPALTPPGVEPGTVAEALPAVQAYLDEPVLLAGFARLDPPPSPEDLARWIVAGARRAAEDAAAIERAAAQIARRHGVTIRQLAIDAGISERAAGERYRLPGPVSPEQFPDLPVHELVSDAGVGGRIIGHAVDEAVTCPRCGQPTATTYQGPQDGLAQEPVEIRMTWCSACGPADWRLVDEHGQDYTGL